MWNCSSDSRLSSASLKTWTTVSARPRESANSTLFFFLLFQVGGPRISALAVGLLDTSWTLDRQGRNGPTRFSSGLP